MTINFKNVGKLKSQQLQENVSGSVNFFGIKTPLRYGGENDGIFALHTSLADFSADNLRNLIQTNHGDRVVLYNYGANLQPLISEFTNLQSFDDEAVVRIKNAVAAWMPFVELDTYESRVDREDNKTTAKLIITISFSVPSVEVFNRKLDVTFYII